VSELRGQGYFVWVEERDRDLVLGVTALLQNRYVLLTQSETGENWRVTLTAAGVPRRDVVGVPLHEAARLALDLLEEEA
jgi:hypothetical protein